MIGVGRDVRDPELAVGVAQEHVLLETALVLLVAVVDGDAGIDRGRQLDVHAAQRVGEAPHVREALAVDAERLVLVQVVGIEDDAVERNPLGAERVGDEHHLRFPDSSCTATAGSRGSSAAAAASAR